LHLSYGTVRESQRKVIHAVRVHDQILELYEADGLAARIRERLAHRGEPAAEVMVVQGSSKDTLRLFGTPYSVNRVRTAMVNAAFRWTPLEID
jgi:hypothetical protein